MTIISQTQTNEETDNLYNCRVSLSFDIKLVGKSNDHVRSELESTHPYDIWKMTNELNEAIEVKVEVEEIDLLHDFDIIGDETDFNNDYKK
jgi:hypothetical protein